MSKDDGGPAYPGSVATSGADDVYTSMTEQETGMSLRDYFAGQALAGYCTLDEGVDYGVLSGYAYEQADAMIKERGKGQ